MRNIVTVTSVCVRYISACVLDCPEGFIGKFDRVSLRRTESTTQRSLQKKCMRDRESETESEREGRGPRLVYKRVRDSNAPHSSWRTITSIHRIRDTDADTWLFRYICPMALSLKWHRESGRVVMERGSVSDVTRTRFDLHFPSLL